MTSSTRLPGLMADIPATASLTFERREMTERRVPPVLDGLLGVERQRACASTSSASAPIRPRAAWAVRSG